MEMALGLSSTAAAGPTRPMTSAAVTMRRDMTTSLRAILLGHCLGRSSGRGVQCNAIPRDCGTLWRVDNPCKASAKLGRAAGKQASAPGGLNDAAACRGDGDAGGAVVRGACATG